MESLNPVLIVVTLVLVLGFLLCIIAPIRNKIKQFGLKVGKWFSVDLETYGEGSRRQEGKGNGVQDQEAEGVAGGPTDRSALDGDIALEEGRTLDEKETDKILAVAVESSGKFPICGHAAVTHGAGSAVARLATRAISDDLGYLQNQFHTRGGEMLREREYTGERLEEYITMLIELKGVLNYVVGARSARPLAQKQNILSKAVAVLTTGNALVGQIIAARASLEGHIGDMKGLRKQISEREREIEDKSKHKTVNRKELAEMQQDKAEWEKNQVQSKLMQEGADLQLLGSELGRVQHDADHFRGAIKSDWDGDLRQIWETEQRPCRPLHERPLPTPD